MTTRSSNPPSGPGITGPVKPHRKPRRRPRRTAARLDDSPSERNKSIEDYLKDKVFRSQSSSAQTPTPRRSCLPVSPSAGATGTMTCLGWSHETHHCRWSHCSTWHEIVPSKCPRTPCSGSVWPPSPAFYSRSVTSSGETWRWAGGSITDSSENWPVIAVVRSPSAGGPYESDGPPDMLEAFMRHAWQVRVGLARNPALSLELQYRLANDSRKEVRRAIANREDAIPDVLRRLGERDPDHVVRMNVLANRSTPQETVEYLAKHGNVVVIRAARKRLERPDIYFADQRLMQLRERLEYRL